MSESRRVLGQDDMRQVARELKHPVLASQPVPIGPLSFKDFDTLANLLRRFVVHHTAPDHGRSIVMDTERMVRNVFVEKYVPNGSTR